MKKVYTFEVKRKIQWPKYRCPKCHNGWIEEWHQIDPKCENDEYEVYPYSVPWFIKCPNCGLKTNSFWQRKWAWKTWKDLCKKIRAEKDKEHDFDYLFTEEE